MKLLPKSLLEIKAKMKIQNILIFAAAFILVTGGLIFLNSIYNNVFKFDFSPISNNDTLTVASTISPGDLSGEIKNQEDKKAKPVEEKDSTKADFSANRLIKETVKDTLPKINAAPQVIPVQDNTGNFSDNSQTAIEPVNEKETVINRSLKEAEVDTIYQQWIKQTAKLYESMDPKKAAMIIKNYSESTARDIIYKMRKKQAAEVLSEMDPVAANRIAQFPFGKDQSSLIKN